MEANMEPLWNAIEGARTDLAGTHYYDPEYNVEHAIPAKDPQLYASAYNYCYGAMDIFMGLSDTIEEIKLIQLQIQHSQDFALQNAAFSTDFILNFSYKNWIIRVNIIAEQLLALTKHIYRLKLSDDNLINTIFISEPVKRDEALRSCLSQLYDFLYDRNLPDINSKNLKRSRNEIVHSANFSHNVISQLSFQLFEYKAGVFAQKDSEDMYLEEGLTSERIKNEISSFTVQLLEKTTPLNVLFADEFSASFNQLMQMGNAKV